MKDVYQMRAELCRSSSELSEILCSDVFLSLKAQRRHYYTNTYDHSVRVAWIVMNVSGNMDASKAALLHDFCDRQDLHDIDVGKKHGPYLYSHPFMAARNAYHYFGSSEKQKRAIRAHMFPCGAIFPSSKMAWMIIYADKVVTHYELFHLRNDSKF